MGLLLVSSFQSLTAFNPDYSRTALGTNEDVVNLCELIVRYKLPTRLSAILPAQRKAGREMPISQATFAVQRAAFPHCLLHLTS